MFFFGLGNKILTVSGMKINYKGKVVWYLI